WLPDYALEEAKKAFESHPYRLMIVTGVPIEQGYFISKEKNYAQLAAKTFGELGINSTSIVQIPCPEVPRNRTYSTARRVAAWLEHQPGDEPVDVFTLGVHARRTWLLYGMVLEANHPAGIIAGEDRRYDRQLWWKTSSGVRTVTDEMIAYLYAK